MIDFEPLSVIKNNSVIKTSVITRVELEIENNLNTNNIFVLR